MNSRSGRLAAAVLLLGAANVAAAAPQPSRWLTAPGAAQFRQVWPAEAAKQQIGGRAVMRCHVEPSGRLSACRIATESPVGMGFGAALLSLVPQFQLRPELIAAQAQEGDIVVYGDWYEFDKAPDWLRKPTAQDLLVVWPKDAWRRGINGKATISCVVSTAGALFDCMVTSESPVGEHFGEAAVALAPQFLMRPATRKGQPVISDVNVPIIFSGAEPHQDSGADSRKIVAAAMAWPQAPTYSEVAAAYPAKAKAAQLGGRATLDCEFTTAGKVRRCDVLGEEPRGQGFGDAAKALAKRFQAFPKTSDGTTLAGATIQLPFVFDPAMLTDAKPLVGKPQWAGLPSTEDTKAAFAAVSKQVTGTVRVTLTCTVQAGGGVGDCSVAREDPVGQGVGQAALALAAHVRVTTWTMEGLPVVGGTINIPIRYEAAAPPPAPAKP